MEPNELAQNAPIYMARLMYALCIVHIVLMAVGGWVIFMFYSRLREIAEEMRKLRIAYEFAQGRRGAGETQDGPGGQRETPFR